MQEGWNHPGVTNLHAFPLFVRAAKIGFLLDSNSRLNDPMVIEMCLTGIRRPGEADVAAFVLQG